MTNLACPKRPSLALFLLLCILSTTTTSTHVDASSPPRSSSTSQKVASKYKYVGSDTIADTNNNQTQACSIFVWDVASLIRYKLCTYLLRRNVYEGKGGRKFVRMKQGSILEYLYPASQHAPDKCARCGHTFDEHLDRWWKAKGLVGTPYDRVLDEMYNEGISVVSYGGAAEDDGGAGSVTVGSDQKNKKWSWWGTSQKKKKKERNEGNNISSSSATSSNPPVKVLSFHKRYVEEIPPAKQEYCGGHRREEFQATKKKQRGGGSNEWRRNPPRSSKMKSADGSNKKKGGFAAAASTAAAKPADNPAYEKVTRGPISYRVPRFNATGLNVWAAGIMYLAREVVLDELDALIRLQTKENRLLERKTNPY